MDKTNPDTTTQASSRTATIDPYESDIKRRLDAGEKLVHATGHDLDTDQNYDMVYVRPSANHLARYMQMSQSQNAFAAGKRLCLDLTVKPTKQELRRQFEREPGLVVSLTGDMLQSVGGGINFERAAL